MLMNAIRIFLAILYSLAFIFSLTGCSPNAASVDKALLRGLHQQNGSGGINVDAVLTFKQPSLKVHFVREKEFVRLNDQPRSKDETRIRLSASDNGTGSLDSLKENGEAEFSLDHSAHLYPAEAWVLVESRGLTEQARNEGCSFDVQPLHEGSWRISMHETEACKDKQEILSQAQELLISFRVKDAHHLIDSVTTPDAP